LQDEYRQWAPGDRPQKIKRDEYRPSDAPFEGKTSNQVDYQPRRAMPLTRSMKPIEREYTKGVLVLSVSQYNRHTALTPRR